MGISKRILLATFGSLGDLHPYLAIAVELKGRGHKPLIVTSASHQARVDAEGIDFAPMRPDPQVWDDDGAVMNRVMDLKNGPEYLIRTLLMPVLRDSYDDLAAACAGVDLVISHPIAFAAPIVAQKNRVPWAGVALSPLTLFSVTDWPIVGPSQAVKVLRSLGPGACRALLALAKRHIHSWSEPVRRLRAEVGLAHSAADPMFEGQFSPTLNLIMFSGALAGPQADWPPNSVLTGFPFYDGPAHSELDREIMDYLADGEPPIVFTLGSAAVMAAGNFYEESVGAARMLGRRALLLVGGNPQNRPTEPLPVGVAAFEYAPYATIFPRAAAIVHQGGIGTTAQAMRSGRPSLVVPWAFDQPDNADRVERLGAARVLPRVRYSARTAARELGLLLEQPSYAATSAVIGEGVRKERGVEAAVDAIEGVL